MSDGKIRDKSKDSFIKKQLERDYLEDEAFIQNSVSYFVLLRWTLITDND